MKLLHDNGVQAVALHSHALDDVREPLYALLGERRRSEAGKGPARRTRRDEFSEIDEIGSSPGPQRPAQLTFRKTVLPLRSHVRGNNEVNMKMDYAERYQS